VQHLPVGYYSRVSNAPSPDEPVSRALLGRAIDYAGLFPPAMLPLSEVLSRYREYRASADAWALGRLVLPADRLAELAVTARASPRASEGVRSARGSPIDPVPISALVGTGTADDVDAIERFNREQTVARVETVEVKAGSAGIALAVLAAIPPGWVSYLEVPVGEAGDAVLDVVAARGVRAKVRTGGTRADAIPDPDSLSHFLTAAEARGVPFKATAGLHHPLRGSFPLTDGADAPSGTMYGYLNLALAALLAWSGRGEAAIREALLESDASALHIENASLCWRHESFPVEILETMRSEFFHGFGSCSFREPLDEWPL